MGKPSVFIGLFCDLGFSLALPTLTGLKALRLSQVLISLKSRKVDKCTSSHVSSVYNNNLDYLEPGKSSDDFSLRKEVSRVTGKV